MTVNRDGQFLDEDEAAVLDHFQLRHAEGCSVCPCTYVLPDGRFTTLRAARIARDTGLDIKTWGHKC